jgi:SAM-dependent methyltransferase
LLLGESNLSELQSPMIRSLLAHPLTKGLDIDDPHTTQLRRQIIQEKSFLRQIYQEWYTEIASTLPKSMRPVLELGAGAGFLKDFVPGLITSEIFHCPEIDVVLNGLDLPFAAGSLQGIVMTDVLHHIPQPRRLFTEAARCVCPGGIVVMIEPWVTPWSRLIYTRLHQEPFQPEAKEWEFPANGPLSGANGALPYIIFARDRLQFEREFPMWQIQAIKPMMPFCYLVSGGISLRSLMPGWSFRIWRHLENAVQPWVNNLAMFAHIELKRSVM